MNTGSVEERLTALEEEVAQLKRQAQPQEPAADAWKQTFGTFAEDDDFDEVLKQGRKYREEQNRQTPE